jgi:hypothetical protein
MLVDQPYDPSSADNFYSQGVVPTRAVRTKAVCNKEIGAEGSLSKLCEISELLGHMTRPPSSLNLIK